MNQQQAQQDLAFIRELMQSTRRATYVSGAYFVIWALVCGLGLLGTWLIADHQLTLPINPDTSLFWLWIVVDGLGVIGTLFVVRRDLKAPTKNPGGRLIGLSWFAVAVGLLTIFFAGVGSGNIPGHLMCAISALFIGIGVFNSGLLAGITWLRNLAFGWWFGGALMLSAPGLWNLWFTALLLIVLYFIPGIVLSRNARR